MQLCLMVATAYHYQQSGMPIELMIVPYLCCSFPKLFGSLGLTMRSTSAAAE